MAKGQRPNKSIYLTVQLYSLRAVMELSREANAQHNRWENSWNFFCDNSALRGFFSHGGFICKFKLSLLSNIIAGIQKLHGFFFCLAVVSTGCYSLDIQSWSCLTICASSIGRSPCLYTYLCDCIRSHATRGPARRRGPSYVTNRDTRRIPCFHACSYRRDTWCQQRCRNV